jgi:hypothetical protein
MRREENMSAYPEDLMPILQRKWESLKKRRYGRPSNLPPKAVLDIILDVAFQATFFTEEGRRPGFRIIYYSPKEYQLQKSRYGPDESRLLYLDQDRPYTASEVNRLAPAAELTRLLICITNVSKNPRSPNLRIWGMLDEGENWWKFIHHETSGGRPPPNHLTITSSSPGELSLSVQGDVLVTLKSGQVFYPAHNALWSGPLADFLGNAKRQLYKDVLKSLKARVFDSEGDDNDYPLRFYTFFLERILFYVRQKQHGGTIIIIPNRIAKEDTRLTDRINIKWSEPLKLDTMG